MRVEQTPFQQFLNGLEEQLRKMSFRNQLAFAASCCERAFPNYVAFNERQHWRDAAVLRLGIDEAWKIICGAKVEESRIRELEARCKVVTPRSDDFPDEDVTAAQEATFMATLLLQFCLDPKPNYAIRIATFSRDTIDLYVQTQQSLDPSDPHLEEKIASHPLMESELGKEKADLAALKTMRSTEELCNFKLRAVAINTSNIGIKNTIPAN